MYQRIIEWVRCSTFENDRGIDYYVPPREVGLLHNELCLGYRRRLIFLVGPQGSGKSSALYYLWRSLLNERYVMVPEGYRRFIIDSIFESLTSGFKEDHFKVFDEFKYLFFDLPDYPIHSAGRMHRDLDALMRGWRNGGYDVSWVVSVQRELFRDHFAFGKGVVVELRRRTPAELMDIYVRRMGDAYPFTEGALLALGVLSRGICRRFIKYVGACSDSFSWHEGRLMTEEDVRGIVTSEVVSRDVDLELSSFLGDSERVMAMKALEVLGEAGEINQKGLAAELDASEATLSRVLRKLERMGWVTRSRGERKELLVRLAPF